MGKNNHDRGTTFSSRVFARIGLLGNPSDLYRGKVISVAIQNYYAEAYIVDSSSCKSSNTGSKGGLANLQQATVDVFKGYMQKQDTAVRFHDTFDLSFSSNIPRQKGLAGSSAIVAATLNVLEAFWGVSIPVQEKPFLILEAETRMGIVAGLQDRVIQVYGGTLFMDFNDKIPKLIRVDNSRLPILYLIHSHDNAHGECSGDIHASLMKDKTFTKSKNYELHAIMEEIASLAEQGLSALLQNSSSGGCSHADLFGQLMTRNFQLRLKAFGSARIGTENQEMVSLAQRFSYGAKLTGSGGAVVCACANVEQGKQLMQACALRGYSCEEVILAPPLHDI